MSTLTVDDIWRFHRRYPLTYDEKYYVPHIAKARTGDVTALEAVTRWKNPSASGNPMNLSKPKRAAFDRLCSGLPRYQQPGGEAELRKDFRWRAPVWSIFWCHVLYSSPIFDRYTRIAWQHLAYQRTLTVKEAIISVPGHWELYDQYRVWFEDERVRLSSEDPRITDRMLDRALLNYGYRLLKKKTPIPSRPVSADADLV